MSLAIRDISKQFGLRTVLERISLEAVKGEMVVLLGPSGCGKSTLLRIIAGLEKADSGSVWLDGAEVTAVEPQHRDVAMVFQNYALYPHMTVRENIAYPLRVRKRSSSQVRSEVDEAARMTNLAALLDRRPGQLSGGEQQRVALARAMVRHPRAFLMDEPFSNLDANLRQAMRVEWKRLHANLGRVTLFVTHDQAEALCLADRIAVMNGGRLVQFGSPREIYNYPADIFVARFIGHLPMNLVAGEVRNGYFEAPGMQIRAPQVEAGPVTLGVRPQDVEIVGPKNEGLYARVESVEFLGDSTVLRLDAGGTNWSLENSSVTGFQPGDSIRISPRNDSIHWFYTGSGQRIRVLTSNR